LNHSLPLPSPLPPRGEGEERGGKGEERTVRYSFLPPLPLGGEGWGEGA